VVAHSSIVAVGAAEVEEVSVNQANEIQYDELRIEHDQGEVEIVATTALSCCSRQTATR